MKRRNPLDWAVWRLVILHRRKVILAWILCFAAGGYAASQLTHRLSYDFSLPGQPAYQTGVKILSLYGNGGNVAPSVFATFQRGSFDWPRLRNESSASRGWRAWATGVARHPWLGLCAALLILGIAMSPVLHLHIGQTSAQAEAQTGSAHREYQTLLSGGEPAGVITPMEVLVSEAHATATARALRGVAGVESVATTQGSAGTRHGYMDIIVVPTIETVSSATLGPTRSVERALSALPGVFGVTGEGPGQQAFTSAVYGNVPLMLTVLAILTFLPRGPFAR